MDKHRNVYVVEPASGKRGPVYGHNLTKEFGLEGAVKAVKERMGITANTITESFLDNAVKFADRPCLGHRKEDGEYAYLTYKEAKDIIQKIAGGLAHVGVKNGDRVCGISHNTPEYQCIIQGTMLATAAFVPLYDTLGEDAVGFCINHSKSSVMFANTRQIEQAIQALQKCDNVKSLIYFGGEITEEQKERLGKVTVYGWEQFLSLEGVQEFEESKVKEEDMAVIIYTSGSTGDPKGVPHTHKAVFAEVTSVHEWLASQSFVFNENDSYMSYLTVAHIFGLTAEFYILSIGAKIGYWRGDIKGLVDDVCAMKPTLFCAVPRVLERVYSAVQDAIKKSGFIKRTLFNFGYNRKKYYLEKGVAAEKASPFFDLLLFKKIQARLGGNVKLILSGSAPLAAHIEEFLRVVFGRLTQGYGLSETCAGSTAGECTDMKTIGMVGVPLSTTQITLEEVTEMNYSPHNDPPTGEVCFRGLPVFKGYLDRKDLTDECMDEEGFFHTGDIGMIDTETGCLKIIDRKKNIFKLSQGEYIAVEKVEVIQGKAESVESLWVYGNSEESALVAVANPKQSSIMSWAAENKKSGSFEELISMPEVKKMVLDEIKAVGRENKLKGFEIVKAVYLDAEPFSVENGLLTPSFKKKRKSFQEHYQKQIDEMYESLKA